MSTLEPESVKRSQNSSAEQSSQSAQQSHEPHHDLFPSERSFFNWLSVCLLGFSSLVFALGSHHIYHNQYRIGDVADHDLVATHASLVIDDAATKKAQEQARRTIMPVFKATKDEDKLTQRSIENLLNGIEKLHTEGIKPLPAKAVGSVQTVTDYFASNNPEADGKLKALAPQLHVPEADLRAQRDLIKKLEASDFELKPFQLTIALLVSDTEFSQYKTTAEKTVDRILKTFHRLPENPSAWLATTLEFLPDDWSPALRESTAQLISSQLQPNMEIDLTATEAKASSSAAAVKPVMKQITVGELIVKKNATITQQEADLLQAMGVGEANRWPFIIGMAISLAAAVALIGLFLFAFEQKHLFATSSVGLMYTVSVVVFAMAALLGKTFPQIVPLPAAALILTIFLGQRVAGAITATVAIFLGADGLIDITNLIALCGGAGAAIGFYSKKRHALMSTGIILAAAQALGFLIASLVQGTTAPAVLIKGMTIDLIGGIILAIVSIGSLPFLESIFGMLTPFRLAELTDADQPLLRKLEENAPGTYQHSLAVANLAEAGARGIGADVNLVRAGAFYHDVGKMVRPKYFIENQLGDTNPHDSMSPEDSRERVLAHVTDGIELAKEYGLPRAVQDFIPMHQGTSLMAYFYHKACLRDGADKVDPLFYRYPGPKPQSKETSIVMLADVSEAVTHSMKDPTQEEVEEAMTKVFQNRWDDGQFSESSLTYAELMRVKKAFVHVWRTLHHERLKYPSTTTGRMAVPPETVPAAGETAHPDANP